jgi:hypothetical protein
MNFYLFAKLVMKYLPDKRELTELVEMARIALDKAKAMYKTADNIATKWEKRLADRQARKQKQGA